MTDDTIQRIKLCNDRIYWSVVDATGKNADCMSAGYLDDEGRYVVIKSQAVFLGSKNKCPSPVFCFHQLVDDEGDIIRGQYFTPTDTDEILCFVDDHCSPWMSV